MKVLEISRISGDHSYWDDERIKKAFNFGNGTFKDMLRYMKDNEKNCRFIVLEEGA